MDTQADGLTMNTDALVELNPKLGEVSHTTRVAYVKFMTTKLKKEIRFEEDDRFEVENEKMRARGMKAFDKFKKNAGILKKVQVVEPEVKAAAVVEEPTTSKDFRSRTPIEEDPNEGMITPDRRPSTPENLLDEPVPKIASSPMQASSPPSSSPIPQVTASPAAVDNKKPDSPIVKIKADTKSPEPPKISTPELPKTDEGDEDDNEAEADDANAKKPDARKDSKTSTHLAVPSASSRPLTPVSPGVPKSIYTGDKGKSKMTGKTLTGWI